MPPPSAAGSSLTACSCPSCHTYKLKGDPAGGPPATNGTLEAITTWSKLGFAPTSEIACNSLLSVPGGEFSFVTNSVYTGGAEFSRKAGPSTGIPGNWCRSIPRSRFGEKRLYSPLKLTRLASAIGGDRSFDAQPAPGVYRARLVSTALIRFASGSTSIGPRLG